MNLNRRALPPRRRRLAGAALAGCACCRTALGGRRRRAAAPHGLHLHAAWGCTRRTSFPSRPARTTRCRPTWRSSRTSATTSPSSPGCRIREVARGHDSELQLPDRRPPHRSSCGAVSATRISLDQFAAEHIGGRDALSQPVAGLEGGGLSWTRSGVLVPSDLSPANVFARLFLEGSPEEVAGPGPPARYGQSISTRRATRPSRCKPASAAKDREKLDEYFTSVRELEQRLVSAEEWSKKPKPKVDAKPPQNPQNGRPHRPTRALVRPDPPGAADRFHAARSPSTADGTSACRRSRACRRPSRPVAPRPGPDQDRPAQDRRSSRR